MRKSFLDSNFSLWIVFNIQSQEIYRLFDKNCIKLENFAVFTIFGVFLGSFWGLWGQPKKSKNLDKYIPHDTNFTSVEFYG